MRSLRTSAAVIIFIAISCVLLTSCRGNGSAIEVDVIYCDDQPVFSFTMEELIHEYNALYRDSHHEDYLRPKGQWELFKNEISPFSEKESTYYRFSYDQTVLTAPTISVYCPAAAQYVSGLTVDFDDHGYSSYLYDVYKEQCYYSVRALLPDCSSEAVRQICDELNALAFDNVQLEGLSADTIPIVLYHTDSVGVFSHFAIGDYVRLCIVPVTQEYLIRLEAQGTELHSISSL